MPVRRSVKKKPAADNGGASTKACVSGTIVEALDNDNYINRFRLPQFQISGWNIYTENCKPDLGSQIKIAHGILRGWTVVADHVVRVLHVQDAVIGVHVAFGAEGPCDVTITRGDSFINGTSVSAFASVQPGNVYFVTIKWNAITEAGDVHHQLLSVHEQMGMVAAATINHGMRVQGSGALKKACGTPFNTMLLKPCGGCSEANISNKAVDAEFRKPIGWELVYITGGPTPMTVPWDTFYAISARRLQHQDNFRYYVERDVLNAFADRFCPNSGKYCMVRVKHTLHGSPGSCIVAVGEELSVNFLKSIYMSNLDIDEFGFAVESHSLGHLALINWVFTCVAVAVLVCILSCNWRSSVYPVYGNRYNQTCTLYFCIPVRLASSICAYHIMQNRRMNRY